MSEEVQNADANATASTEAAATAPVVTDPGDESALGDAGKKALDAMKAERNQAKKESADLAKRLKAFEDAQKSSEQKAEEAAAAAEKRATAAVERIAAAEVRAALTGVVPDPKAVIEDLNLSKFITPDGDVDSAAVDKLKEKYSSLFPANKSIQPNPAQGSSGKKPPQGQLTRDALKTMSPEQILEAQKAGLLNSLLGQQ